MEDMLSSKAIAKSYDEMSYEMAKCIAKIDEMRGRCEFFSDAKRDNADPEIETGNALEKLAVALSSMVIYAHEYAEEAKEEDQKNQA